MQASHMDRIPCAWIHFVERQSRAITAQPGFGWNHVRQTERHPGGGAWGAAPAKANAAPVIHTGRRCAKDQAITL